MRLKGVRFQIVKEANTNWFQIVKEANTNWFQTLFELVSTRVWPSLRSGGSAGISREVFVREDLQRWGLCGPLGESAPDARWKSFGGVAARRRLVGEYLGVGDCDAKQLLRQMNLFFSADEARRICASFPSHSLTRWFPLTRFPLTLAHSTRPFHPVHSR